MQGPTIKMLNGFMNISKNKITGKFPPYFQIAENLWGKDADFDSDGNAKNLKDDSWNELTIILRSDNAQRVDIDPIDGYDEIQISSENRQLVDQVVSFMQSYGSII